MLLLLVAVPYGVVTLMSPVVAPLNIPSTTVVGFTTVNEGTGLPPMLTAVAPQRLVPVMVMLEPTVTVPVGVNELITGKAPPLRLALPAP